MGIFETVEGGSGIIYTILGSRPLLYQVGVLNFRLEVLAPDLGTPYLEAVVAS